MKHNIVVISCVLLPYWRDSFNSDIESDLCNPTLGITVNLSTLICLHQEISFRWIENGMHRIICANKSLPGLM